MFKWIKLELYPLMHGLGPDLEVRGIDLMEKVILPFEIRLGAVRHLKRNVFLGSYQSHLF